MSDRAMIACLLSALEYHAEQTRPIQSTSTAIAAAREHLRQKQMLAQPAPLTDEQILKLLRPDVWAHVEGHTKDRMLSDARAIERAYGIGSDA
jgi:hypothetical protein